MPSFFFSIPAVQTGGACPHAGGMKLASRWRRGQHAHFPRHAASFFKMSLRAAAPAPHFFPPFYFFPFEQTRSSG